MEGEKPNLKNDPYRVRFLIFPPLLSLCHEQGQLQRATGHLGQGANFRERNSVFLVRGPGKAALALRAAPIGRNCSREVAETPKAKQNNKMQNQTRQYWSQRNRKGSPWSLRICGKLPHEGNLRKAPILPLNWPKSQLSRSCASGTDPKPPSIGFESWAYLGMLPMEVKIEFQGST